MANVFVCSLCHKGPIGGALYLEAEGITFRSNKLTADKKFRNLSLPIKEIMEITWEQFLFPITTFHMENGESYKLMIFQKTSFCKYYQQLYIQ
jgi:hypothetical protein